MRWQTKRDKVWHPRGARGLIAVWEQVQWEDRGRLRRGGIWTPMIRVPGQGRVATLVLLHEMAVQNAMGTPGPRQLMWGGGVSGSRYWIIPWLHPTSKCSQHPDLLVAISLLQIDYGVLTCLNYSYCSVCMNIVADPKRNQWWKLLVLLSYGDDSANVNVITVCVKPCVQYVNMSVVSMCENICQVWVYAQTITNPMQCCKRNKL